VNRPATGSPQGASRRSLGRGFSELGGRSLRQYLGQSDPIDSWHPEGDQAAATRRRYGAIAIASGKGGTGKTTVAANLATLLGGSDLRVLLIDADFGLANLHFLLGLQPKTSLARLLLGGLGAREVAMEGPKGVRVIPGCSGVERMANLDDGQMHTLARALAEAEEGTDIVLLDTAAGLARQNLALLRASAMVLVVTTPDIPAMTDAYGLIKLLSRSSTSIPVGLLVNRARNRTEAEEVALRLTSLSEKFLGRKPEPLGWVPEDSSFSRRAAEGKPLVLADPQSAAAGALKSVADKLLSSVPMIPQARLEERYFDHLCEVLARGEPERV